MSVDVSLTVVAPNRAPVFAGTPELTNNAPPGYLVSLTLFRSDFTDPDGDPLTFEISTSRGDVVASGGITHVERFGRLFFVAKTACALLELDPEPGEVYETTVTTTATDPDGATATATRIFRTDPTWSNSTESLEDDCPQATGAQVDGATLVISLDGAVAISIEPPTPAEFAVTADGAAVSRGQRARDRGGTTPRSPSTLASPVTQGQAVAVSYAPGDYAIAAAFTDQPATNNTQPPPEPPAPVCVTAPEGATAPTCAAVSGNDLIVTFNADLAPIDAATASALRFSIFVDGAYHNGAPHQLASRPAASPSTATPSPSPSAPQYAPATRSPSTTPHHQPATASQTPTAPRNVRLHPHRHHHSPKLRDPDMSDNPRAARPLYYEYQDDVVSHSTPGRSVSGDLRRIAN